MIWKYAAEDPSIIGISQSRNRGHQNALLAGLMEAKDHCDITITIDCDGQDTISAMEQMVDAYHAGAEIVYGVRSDRKTDSWFKRSTAQGFYRVLAFLGAEVIDDHADYRLVSSKVLHHFSDFQEVNIYLRGLFPLVGFNSTCVYYERNPRLAGETHYPLGKMLALAWDGITSLSVKPITLIIRCGLLVSLLGIMSILWASIEAISGHTVAGWRLLFVSFAFYEVFSFWVWALLDSILAKSIWKQSTGLVT